MTRLSPRSGPAVDVPASFAVLAVLAALLSACGGDGSKCGNGAIDPGEQCDDGNADDTDSCQRCQIPAGPGVTIKWTFNPAPAVGFEGDSCADVGALEIDVVLVDAAAGATVRAARVGCSERQVVFAGIRGGSFRARVTPLDATGASLVTAPVELAVETTGSAVIADLAVPPEAWLRAYTGSLFFTLRWDRRECQGAAPPVVQQVLSLTRDGAPIATATTAGTPLDGSAPGACLPSSATQTALEVPFGPATLRVSGLDEAGVTRFEQAFDTFVGAGPFNPEFAFDVAALPPDMPDAGVPDAAPDAGPPDAAPDAGPPDAAPADATPDA